MSNSLKKTDNIEIELNDNSILSNLFGVNDSNLQIIEKINDVKIQYRGNKIKIFGNKKSIYETKETIFNLFDEARKGIEIDEDIIKDNKSISSMENNLNNQSDVFIQTKKRKIVPRTKNQKNYFME